MCAVFVEDRACHSVPDWHDAFLTSIVPAVETVARGRFRGLPAGEREEAQAEAVATAMLFVVRLVQRGKSPTAFVGRLAQIAVLRVLAGRLVGSGERSRDVLSRAARQRRGFTVASLDSDETHADAGWQAIIVEDRQSTPADIAVCRIDFGAWLEGMNIRHRELAEMLAAGHSTSEAAERFKLSRSRISQLRREFEDSWREFQHQADEWPTAA